MNTTTDIHEAAHGLVASHPGILGGKPVFRGTRLPVATLFGYLADGLTLDYFLETFPSIQREQATHVLRYGLGQEGVLAAASAIAWPGPDGRSAT